MTRVLAYCPQALDGTAYWRAAAPLAYLARQASDFRYQIVEGIDTNAILACDVLLLQRPFLNEHVTAMRKAQLLGRKVWCDWDDDILHIPMNNPRVFQYERDEFKNNVRELAGSADVVTVTNKALARVYRAAGAREPVILPNALDPTLALPPARTDVLPVRRVAWRGGDSHNQDLLATGDIFPRVAHEFVGDCLWHFVGFTPHWLVDAFPDQSLTLHPWIGDVSTYLRFMGTLRPSILAVPLVNDAFNRCKSSISVIEAAWMGAVPVAPSWLEGCALDGVVTYDDLPGFGAALRSAVAASDAELVDRLARLRAAVAKDWTLDSANLVRALVLKRLLGGKETSGEATVPAAEPPR